MVPSRAPLPQSFVSKKRKILEKLAVPASEYDDLSPKGSIDEGIRDLIDEINEIEGCVTTSSCAGRTSIFLEGKKHTEEDEEDDEDDDEVEDDKGNEEVETRAGVGGKGGGGRWLYVSHSPLDWSKHEKYLAKFFGMDRRVTELSRLQICAPSGWQRWVHFKFEPMILHILTASLEQAQIVLSAALQAGFRESGAINLVSSTSEPSTPMVAVRSMGLSLESIVGYGQGDSLPICTISEESLQTLVEQANERFTENTKRIERFRSLLKKLSAEDAGEVKRKGEDGGEWEDPQVRRERKRAEGLARSQQIRSNRPQESPEDVQEAPGLELLGQNT